MSSCEHGHENCADDAFNEMRERVRAAGFAVHMKSSFCQTFMAKANSCEGCESEQGCSRVNHLMQALHLLSEMHHEGKINSPLELMAAKAAFEIGAADIINKGVIRDKVGQLPEPKFMKEEPKR